MGEVKRDYGFVISITENTGWGLTGKTFSDNHPNADRARVIVEVIEYLSKNCHEDYVKAVKILREKKKSNS